MKVKKVELVDKMLLLMTFENTRGGCSRQDVVVKDFLKLEKVGLDDKMPLLNIAEVRKGWERGRLTDVTGRRRRFRSFTLSV